MNEVRPIQLNAPLVVRAASSQSQEVNKELPEGGKDLPVEPKEIPGNLERVEKAKDSQLDIEQAVTEINEYVQSVQRDLHFSVDEDSGLTVIRVKDKESGELIRQIPEDIFLNLAQNLKDTDNFNLLDARG